MTDITTFEHLGFKIIGVDMVNKDEPRPHCAKITIANKATGETISFSSQMPYATMASLTLNMHDAIIASRFCDPHSGRRKMAGCGVHRRASIWPTTSLAQPKGGATGVRDGSSTQ